MLVTNTKYCCYLQGLITRFC